MSTINQIVYFIFPTRHYMDRGDFDDLQRDCARYNPDVALSSQLKRYRNLSYINLHPRDKELVLTLPGQFGLPQLSKEFFEATRCVAMGLTSVDVAPAVATNFSKEYNVKSYELQYPFQEKYHNKCDFVEKHMLIKTLSNDRVTDLIYAETREFNKKHSALKSRCRTHLRKCWLQQYRKYMQRDGLCNDLIDNIFAYVGMVNVKC